MTKINPIINTNGFDLTIKKLETYPYSNKLNNNVYLTNSIYSQTNKIPFASSKFYLSNNQCVSFMGRKVHIVDGGNHATNMEHFAHAISNDIDTTIYEVETNPKDKNIKQLKSLEQKLKNLNLKQNFKDEYIAIPALASVAMLNIQDQYNKVMNENKKFTPENIKSNKKLLLDFLEKIYNNPQNYSIYIGYMDPNKQGIEYTFGVIQEINKLKNKGAKVYIPSGHPQDETLKWMAAQRGLKPELYYYIATGNDKDKCIERMHQEIKDKNWYDFNLLSLSEANVIGVKGSKGAQDYMFAAYDSCITDGARGVYNFSPIRMNNRLIGYSYTDTSTNEYPFEKFPANNEVENLVKFVGKNYLNVIATEQETEELKQSISNKLTTSNCADKLYLVKDIFSDSEIKKEKMNLRGEYIDKSLKLFFSKNSNGEIIFPKCDCEGSGKPSVLSMWGSCFAVFNAIARDIRIEMNYPSWKEISSHENEMKYLKKQGQYYYANGFYKQSEDFYNNAINTDKAFSLKQPDYFLDYEPYYLLGNLHYNNQHLEYASSCYNNAINIVSKYILEKEKNDLPTIKRKYQEYYSSKNNSESYRAEIRNYDSKSAFIKFFIQKPIKPYNYNDYKKHNNDINLYNNVLIIAEMYNKLSNICRLKNENYPAKICEMAAEDIKNFTQVGNKILQYRSQGVEYIGDLYNEIKSD